MLNEVQTKQGSKAGIMGRSDGGIRKMKKNRRQGLNKKRRLRYVRTMQ